MSGAKGAGLSLMIECLVSLVAGNPVLAPILAGGSGTNMNALAVALNLSAFGQPAEMLAAAASLASLIEAQPTASAADRLRMPGARGEEVALRRSASGIPLPHSLWQRITELNRKD
jgi:ureidoglycolate dehydrogenase (NAD+)